MCEAIHLVVQHFIELLLADWQSLSVGAVHHHYEEVGAGVVGTPGLSQRLLTSNVPHHKVQVLPSHLHTETKQGLLFSLQWDLYNALHGGLMYIMYVYMSATSQGG